jgi:predicted transcriptional regulator
MTKDSRVLRVLTSTGWKRTGHIVRDAHMDSVACAKALRRLVDMGAVERTTYGHARLYRRVESR